MTPIIDPRVFYWMSVINDIKAICIVLFILSIVGLVLCFVFYVDDLCIEEDGRKKCKRGSVIFAILTALFAFGIIFIPSKTTMTEMLIAKYATTENAELGVNAIKNLVDYIVSAMQSVK